MDSTIFTNSVRVHLILLRPMYRLRPMYASHVLAIAIPILLPMIIEHLAITILLPLIIKHPLLTLIIKHLLLSVRILLPRRLIERLLLSVRILLPMGLIKHLFRILLPRSLIERLLLSVRILLPMRLIKHLLLSVRIDHLLPFSISIITIPLAMIRFHWP